MKITHHWLREFAHVTDTPAELAARLTLAGLEVEALEPVAPPFTGVVVGAVLEVAQHPDAQKLSVCQVTTDGADRLQIICGAPNVRAGLKVAVARVGARLPGEVHIKRAKLRGLESSGMLCSARELGLGDEHDGIMELDERLPLGRDLREALDLDAPARADTATPIRVDGRGVWGIARDCAAALARRRLEYRVDAVPARSTEVFPVRIEAPGSCPVFASRVIRGIAAGARSPFWLRERLRRVGINSISVSVDVTNYVMTELGQPMHAYDLERLAGGIRVRMARPGERATLLDGREYALEADQLVIADERGAVGLAGIMGGRDTAIAPTTTSVLLESAHFTPAAVAGRARRRGLVTDAAQRFERGVDPTLPERAIERATALLLEIAGGEAGPVQVTRGEAPAAPPWVALRRERLARLLGAAVPDSEAEGVLRAIGDAVEPTADGWRLRKPPHRFDIAIEADLIEEVARLRGFDLIPEAHAAAPQIAGFATESQVAPERVLAAMADRGYREAITYSFVDPSVQRRLFPDAGALTLRNPIAADMSQMRVSLWPGLLQACRENLRRQQTRVRLFELGKKFVVSGDGLHEVETLAGLAVGARWPEQWGAAREPLDYHDVQGDLMAALALGGDTGGIRFEADVLHCLRPGRTARILRDGAPIGWLGELHPEQAKALGLTQIPLLFELEISSAFSSKMLKYRKISKFPSVRRDLAVVVDEAVPLAVLQENVTVSASGLLSELRVFDVYRGPGVETGRKSIALGLILQDSSRTLTDVDADAVVTAVVARLRDELSAAIRDQ